MIQLQVCDPDEFVVTVNLSGRYSPDVLDDAKRRLLDIYRDAMEVRLAALGGLVLEETDGELVEGEAE